LLIVVPVPCLSRIAARKCHIAGDTPMSLPE
jgi:hypothetical protein